MMSGNMINWFVFVMDLHCVVCEVGTAFLNISLTAGIKLLMKKTLS